MTDPKTPVPVVDSTAKLVGDTATIFQRMNGKGDMLRVATNIKGGDGKRILHPRARLRRDAVGRPGRDGGAGVDRIRGVVALVDTSSRGAAEALKTARTNTDHLDELVDDLTHALTEFKI